MLDKAIFRARDFDSVDFDFDHDEAGFAASSQLLGSLPDARDCSGDYSGFKDYNEWLCATLYRQANTTYGKGEDFNLTR
jgi:hypothetical protein